MASAKSKAKKTSGKKELLHDIPAAKTAKGRRPHTEKPTEPYQPSLLSEADMEPRRPLTTAEVEVTDTVAESENLAGSSKETMEHGSVKTSKRRKNTNAPEVTESSVAAEVAPATTESIIVEEEVVLEGQPAPEPERTKIDLKEQMEKVKGAVQMGTAIMKSSFPKSFEFAERIVEDWKQDGDFSELPIDQPLVQFYVGLGLRKAKQTEKDLEQKLETTGVLPVVRQQWQKAQKLFK